MLAPAESTDLNGKDRFAAQGLGEAQEPSLDLVADQRFLATAHAKLDRAIVQGQGSSLEHRADTARQPLAEAHGEAPAMGSFEVLFATQLREPGLRKPVT